MGQILLLKKPNKKDIIFTIIVLTLLLFSYNQLLSFSYKVKLLTNPCDLCLKENPKIAICFNNKVIPDDMIKIMKNETEKEK